MRTIFYGTISHAEEDARHEDRYAREKHKGRLLESFFIAIAVFASHVAKFFRVCIVCGDDARDIIESRAQK